MASVRRLALLLCLALVAVACGGGDDADTAESTTSTTAAPTTTTEAPAETTTTAAETTTTTTEVEVPTGPTWPLTGVLIGGDEPGEPVHPAVVVKISNNDATARQVLRGLDQADIVFEERIEQSATRFATVFHSQLPTEVGSVRSARTSDIDIVANLNGPIFAFSGANNGVLNQVRTADRNGVLVMACEDCSNSQFSLLDDFRRPNRTVVDTLALLDEAPEDSGPPSAIYDYSNNVAELGEPTAGVQIAAAVAANFVWSEADGGWLRYQGPAPHVTRDDVQITPQNVIVMTTQYLPSQIDSSSVDAITVGTREVVVYSNGHRVEGTWTRETADDGYTLETADGEIIGLAPGQTWVSMTPAGTSRELTADEAASFTN
jgi:hypothetical protein